MLDLEKFGYSFSSSDRVWSKQKDSSFNYSDGDALEKKLDTIIKSVKDKSIFSEELASHIVDWPTFYYLSPTRTNLLRPIESCLSGEGLELGCGCGALTGFLAEKSKSVLALEGSRRRASITSERCSDLANVQVVCDDIMSFSVDANFNWISLIGVLEYMNCYGENNLTLQDIFKHLSSFLAKDGFLIIAIENKLGLKYFSGADEDHLNEPYIGICDQYSKDSPTTYTKDVLTDSLSSVGFSEISFFYPYPDYKQPRVVFSDLAEKNIINVNSIISGISPSYNDEHFVNCVFDEKSAWRSVTENRNWGTFANSFLIVASKTKCIDKDDVIAYSYTTSRRAGYASEVDIVEKNNEVSVVRRRLFDGLKCSDDLIQQSLSDGKYIHGELFSERLFRILVKPGWNFLEVVSWTKALYDFLMSNSKKESAGFFLPPDFLDCIPCNIVVDENNAWHYIDREWCYSNPLSIQYLLFRGIKNCILSNPWIATSSNTSINKKEFIINAINGIGLDYSEENFKDDCKKENEIFFVIYGIKVDLAEILKTPLFYRSPLNRVGEHLSSYQKNQDLMNDLIEKQKEEINVLEQEKSNLTEQKVALEQTKGILEEEKIVLEQTKGNLEEEKATLEQEKGILEEEKAELEQEKINLGQEISILKSNCASLEVSILSQIQTVTLCKKNMEICKEYMTICEKYESQLNSMIAWKNGADIVSAGLPWKIMRFLRRFNAMFVQGKDGGRSAFIKWMFGRKYKNYDPLSSFPTLEVLSNPKLLDIGNTQVNTFRAPIPVEPSYSVLRQGEILSGDVDIVIPLKNAINWLSLSLMSLFDISNIDRIHKVVIVDDGSNEDDFELLQKLLEKYPSIALLRNEGQHGFASTCNCGASICDAEYIIFLNSDCLISPNTLTKLVDAANSDPKIGLVCPLANNAANVSMLMPPGMSVYDIDNLLDAKLPAEQKVQDVCTIVGQCLLVKKKCFDDLLGFDQDWGLGYGEESDLHMRAIASGYRGVVAMNCYVYHYGGGTFRYETTRESLTKKNYERFILKWGDFYRRCYEASISEQQIADYGEWLKIIPRVDRPDVLFVLPGFSQGVGGIQVVADISNYLLMRGVNAKILILGSGEGLKSYKELLLQNPYLVGSESELLNLKGIEPKNVVATLFTTTAPALKFARKHNAKLFNFIQGYEFFFENAIHYNDVQKSYELMDEAITTSNWLDDNVRKHAPDKTCHLLPLGVDSFQFFPLKRSVSSKVRIGIVFRASADKGQWILADICDELSKYSDKLCFTLFLADVYIDNIPECIKNDDSSEIIILPVDRDRIAKSLQKVDIFVDASLHEGFGLMPLEAMACGAVPVVSDSGGVNSFITNNQEGIIISEVNKPEAYVKAVLELVDNLDKLVTLRQNALNRSRELNPETLYNRYLALFKD